MASSLIGVGVSPLQLQQHLPKPLLYHSCLPTPITTTTTRRGNPRRHLCSFNSLPLSTTHHEEDDTGLAARQHYSHSEGFKDDGDYQEQQELAIAYLGLPEQLVTTLHTRAITHLFPIQRAVLLPALQGRDLIARAKTGTGKTLAFGIPIIKKLMEEDQETNTRQSARLPRVLVLAPTRELAKQVDKEIKESAPYLNTVCIYGGVSYNAQQNALTRGVDVVVGTPGRLIDLINSNILQLGEVKYLVLDEADQMLAVGFEEDVEVILEKLPSKRQSMLFSATMPDWVQHDQQRKPLIHLLHE